MTDPDHFFTEEQSRTITRINITSSAFSFMGSSFILLCYWQLKEIRSFAFTLVALVSMSDLGFSIFGFMGDASRKWGELSSQCTFQAVGIQFFSVASLLWASSMAAVMHYVLLRNQNPAAPAANFGRIKLGVLAACILLTILPTFSGSYGDAEGWCWVKDDTKVDKAMRFLSFYLWVWTAVIYSAWVFYHVYQKMSEQSEVSGDSAEPSAPAERERRRVVRRLKFYPLALVGCWFFGSINRLYQLFADPVFVLTCLQIFTSSLLGAINAAVYGLTPVVQKSLKNYLKGGGEAPEIEDTTVKDTASSSDVSHQGESALELRQEDQL